MKRKVLRGLEKGDKAAIGIYDAAGRQLVKKGAEFTAAIAEKLKFHEIPFVYTEGEGITVNCIFKPALIAELLRVIWHYTESGGKNSSILKAYGTEEIKMFAAYSNEPAAKMAYGHIFRYLAQKMLDCLKGCENIVFDFMDYRGMKSYINYHAVNTACIAMIVGKGMGLKEKELADLCAGVLLSDLKMKTYGFTENARLLTGTEKEEVKQHVLLGCEDVRSIYGMTAAAAGVVAQHHERADGSGYPKGIRGKDINSASRAAAVADVYDALLSQRPYRKAYFPDEAWDYIAGNKGTLFDAEAAGAFMKVAAKYLPGDIVALNNGQEAMVTANTPGKMREPIIKIIEKKGKSDIISDAAIDISKQKEITILRVIKSARREE